MFCFLRSKKKTTAPNGRGLFPDSSWLRSELLVVAHVEEAARDFVLRIERVGEGGVRLRRVTIEGIVHADGDLCIPRGLPVAAQIGVGHAWDVTLRISLVAAADV